MLFAALAWRTPALFARLAHAALVFYVAVNTMLVRAIGTPLLASMLRGVDGAMQDSATYYLHFHRLWPVLVVGSVGALAARLARALSVRTRLALGTAAVLVTLTGLRLPPPAPAQRNAIVALLRSALPRVWADAGSDLVDLRQPRPTPLERGLDHLPGCARGRSVVVVVLESAAARFIGAYGATPDAMPFVSEMAQRSLLCTRAWAVYPESIKGQLALWHSVAPAPDLPVRQHARVPVPGLATLLASAGYDTALFHAGRFRFLGMDEVLASSGFATKADAAVIGGDHESSFGVDEESTVAALLRHVDTLPADQPFLAAYLPVAGHHPYASPPGGPFARDNVLDCYRAALHYADSAVRTLWQGLCQRRAPRDLVLCIVGDHGQAFGEHAGNFGHTFAVYEENLMVPLSICVPGVTDAGMLCHRLVSHLDLAPTLLHLLGQPACAGHQGTSLLLPAARRAFAFTDWGDALVAVREEDWKLVLDVGSGVSTLFDLAHDPNERVDLSARQGDRAAAFGAAARAWVAAARARVAAW